jgi:hypothetical protein
VTIDEKGSSNDQNTLKVKSYAYNDYYNKAMPYYHTVYDGGHNQGKVGTSNVIKDKFKHARRLLQISRSYYTTSYYTTGSSYYYPSYYYPQYGSYNASSYSSTSGSYY